jgi:hypothetical protein
MGIPLEVSTWPREKQKLVFTADEFRAKRSAVARAQIQRINVETIDYHPSDVAQHAAWLPVRSMFPQMILDEGIPAFSDGRAGHL